MTLILDSLRHQGTCREKQNFVERWVPVLGHFGGSDLAPFRIIYYWVGLDRRWIL